MQIKPHQIPHFARQRERLTAIRNDLDAEMKEEGSYFSMRFVGVNQFVNWFSAEILEAVKKSELDLLMKGSPIENNVTPLWDSEAKMSYEKMLKELGK